MKLRKEKVDGKSIYIIDDVLNKEYIDKFHELLLGFSYSRNERDDLKDKYPIFSADFIPEKLENTTEIGKKARELLEKYFPDKNYFLSRSYINMSHYGDMEYPHRDCLIGEEDITVLYYGNNHWDYRWGGETVFYENKEPKILVLPTPGRFLIFPGQVEHLGSVPTRDCNISRFSCALKYKVTK